MPLGDMLSHPPQLKCPRGWAGHGKERSRPDGGFGKVDRPQLASEEKPVLSSGLAVELRGLWVYFV